MIFITTVSEYVKQLQLWREHLAFQHVYFKRKLSFFRNMRDVFNPVVLTCHDTSIVC